MNIDEIRRRFHAGEFSQVDMANMLGIDPTKVSKSLSTKGKPRKFTAEEMDKIRAWLGGPSFVGTPITHAIPIIGQVAAGNWREAVQRSSASMPSPDPSIPAGTFALDVVGDSMDLYVVEGGKVIVDPNDRALYPGRFYVVLNADGEATFKRFETEPARLVPCSSNAEHREMLLGNEGFSVVGRVIWRASRM